MKPILVTWLVVMLVSGCGGTGDDAQSSSALSVPADGEIFQRSTVVLPGSGGQIFITLGDITRGRVKVSLSGKDGSPIMAERFLREMDSADFTFEEESYQLKLLTLTNRLAGEDTAEIRVDTRAAGEAAAEDSGRREIDALISSLRELEGAVFIRNGKEYTVEEAIAHLARKRSAGGSEIRTAEDFIRKTGSKSSTTGDPYLIRSADGTMIEARKWFVEKLKQSRKDAGKVE